MSKQLADWTIPDDTDEQSGADRFEEEAAHALTAAARDLAARGWTPHDLANLVAEAVAPELPAPSTAELNALAILHESDDPFAG